MSSVNNKIYSKEKSSHWFLIIIGLIFILILIPTYSDIFHDLERGRAKGLIPLVFPLFGIYAIVVGLKVRRNFLSIGLMPVTLSPSIGQVGGQVGGHIELPQPWEKRQLNLTLSCLHTWSNGNGKNSTTHTNIIWKKNAIPVDKPHLDGSLLEFCFDVIDDLPINGTHNGKGTIHWELMLEGVSKGITIKRHWKIPVEKGDKTSSIVIPDHHRLIERETKTSQAIESVTEQIHIELNNNELYLLSETGRNNKVSIPFIIFGLIFTGGGAFLFSQAIKGDLILWLMAPIFTLVGLSVFTYGLYLKGRKLESKIRGEQVYVRRIFFGKVIYKRQGLLNSAMQIKLNSSLSSQQGSKKTEYMYITADVMCNDKIRRKLKLVEGIQGRPAGEAMQKQIFNYMQR